MLFSSALMIILYLVFRYVLAWIRYFNSLDSRLGQSTWRWSYDYPVVGERDISDLDCLLYTSPSPRDVEESRMPSSA